MAQCATKRVNIRKVMSRPAFLPGVKDAMNGFGFYERYDAMPTSDQWSYERGRQFYFAAGKMRIKQGRGISFDAVQTYKALRADNTIL